MVPFAGWEMPVQFSGLIQEHKAVRERVGMFDISHMGVLRLEGANPKDALQKLIPSDLYRIGPGEACYSVLLTSAAAFATTSSSTTAVPLMPNGVRWCW